MKMLDIIKKHNVESKGLRISKMKNKVAIYYSTGEGGAKR